MLSRNILRSPTALSLAALLVIGCGDDDGAITPPPPTGTLSVSTTSIGSVLDPDGYTLVVDGSDSVAVGVNDSATADIPVGQYSAEITGLANNCGVIGDNPVSTTLLEDEVATVEFSVACPPFYDYIAISGYLGGGGIYVMKPDGSNPVNVTKHITPEVRGCYLDWSPDGTRLMFRLWRDGAYELQVMSVDGSLPVTVLRQELMHDAEWSPVDDRIAYTGENHDIWVMGADGSNPVNVTNSADPEFDLAWSPDANRIAFTKAGADFGLYVMDVDGSNRELLRAVTDMMHTLAWSPDGSRIAYIGSCETDPIGTEICTVDADGSNPTNITNYPQDDWWPDWSPDGSRLACMSRRGDADATIYVMQSDGSNAVPLAEGGNCPAWSPGQ